MFAVDHHEHSGGDADVEHWQGEVADLVNVDSCGRVSKVSK